MELRQRKTRAPLLPMLVAITLLLLQLWAASAQVDENESSIQTSVNNVPAKSPTRSLSTTISRSVTKKGFSFKWRWRRRRRRRRNKANKHRIEFLHAHNKVRAKVGEPPLKWNGMLAAYARGWAKQRVGDCRLVHSNGPYGENIFWAGKNKWKPRDVVKVWADEYKFYDIKSNTCVGGQMCGHYTQIVWRDSTEVGCARVDCSNGGFYAICVYNPPGNFEGEIPFVSYKKQFSLSRHDSPAKVVKN